MKKYIIPLVFIFLLFIAVLDNIGLYKLISDNSLSSKFNKKQPNANSNLRFATSLWKNIRDIRIASDEYLMENNIGQGGWSKVYKGIHKPTGETVALKYFFYEEGIKLQREITILEDLKDAPNFLPLKDLFEGKLEGKEAIVSVYDCFEKENYKDVFSKLNRTLLKRFMYETLRTINYAHKKWIIHRDIKPGNVLMNTKTLEVRIIDWGISEYYVPSQTLPIDIGTMPFQPPEVLLGYGYYGTAYDLWSTAWMFAEMAFQKKNLFKTKRNNTNDTNLTKNESRMQKYRELLDDIAQVFGSQDLIIYANKIKNYINPENLDFIGSYQKTGLTKLVNQNNAHLIDSNLIDLFEKMFTYDPQQRITASEALEHPYFEELRKKQG